MKKILIFIIFVLFVTGCSNISTLKNDVTEVEKQSLLTMITVIQKELRNGQFDTFDRALVPGLKNSMLKKEIETVDFSKINILTTKPVFNKRTAENVVALIYGTDTLYLNVEYLLKNGEWKISKFKERRG